MKEFQKAFSPLSLSLNAHPFVIDFDFENRFNRVENNDGDDSAICYCVVSSQLNVTQQNSSPAFLIVLLICNVATSMDRYEILDKIGAGGEGSVFRVRKTAQTPSSIGLSRPVFCLKKRRCTDLGEANTALAEAVAMAKIQSTFVVHYEGK
jgi:hypothetical protein